MNFEPLFADKPLDAIDVESITYRPLTILLTHGDGKHQAVAFPHIRSFRVTDEGDRLILVSALLAEHPELHWIYRVPNSEYLAWMNSESHGIKAGVPCTCYLVVTRSELIEVLAYADPVVPS